MQNNYSSASHCKHSVWIHTLKIAYYVSSGSKAFRQSRNQRREIEHRMKQSGKLRIERNTLNECEDESDGV